MTASQHTVGEGMGPVPHAPIRHLLARLFGKRVVVLIDFDGEANVRVEWLDALGRPFAARMLVRRVLLNADGSTTGASYVKRWLPVADYRRATGKTGGTA